MSCDLFVLNALACELNEQLVGGKVDKITQPEEDEVRFFVRNRGQNLCLVASCNAQASRLHLTENKKQNPLTAYALCMLLRKHLLGARIESIAIFNRDRTVCIEFTGRTEMQDEAHYKVFIELMNRYSNIVFTDGNDLILDAVKRLPIDNNREHVVLRGLMYEPIKQPKSCVFSAQNENFADFSDTNLHEFILSNFSGFSRSTVNELIHRCDVNLPLTTKQTQKIVDMISQFENITQSNEFAPCIIDNSIYPMPFKTLLSADNQSKPVEYFPTLSHAFDALNSQIDAKVRIKAKTKHLVTAVTRMQNSTKRRMASNIEKLKECENMEQVKIFGELIVSNIYKIPRGSKSVIVKNYYTGKDVVIALDEKLSPAQNSSAYFKKYTKLKRTKVFLKKKMIDDEILLDYLKSIEDSLSQVEFDDNLTDIENELSTIGALKQANKKRTNKREIKQPPLEYRFMDFTILKGRNNTQNDFLTFKVASSRDVWLHLKNAHGAHCVILCEGKIPPNEVIKFAAEVTASTQNESAEVDYTERKNVKRMPQGHPAQVTYTNYKTITASPNSHSEFLV